MAFTKKTLITTILIFLTIPLVRHYAPKVSQHFSAPQQCTEIINLEGKQTYCLDDQFRAPLECIWQKKQKENLSTKCFHLLNLAQRNKKELSFEAFGYKIEITKIK